MGSRGGFNCKNTGGVYECMGEDTGEDTAADVEKGGVAESDGGGIYKLQQSVKNWFSQE